jgi:hypothetical protein
VIGLLASLSELNTLTKMAPMPLVMTLVLWFGVLAGTGFAVGFIVAGLQLKKVLPLGARWILSMLVLTIAAMVLETILVVAVFGVDLGTAGAVGAIIRLAISAYLLANLRRLASEAVAATGVPPARAI